MKTIFYFSVIVLAFVGCSKPSNEPEEPRYAVTREFHLIDDCTSLPITDCLPIEFGSSYCCQTFLGTECPNNTSKINVSSGSDCEFSIKILHVPGKCGKFGVPIYTLFMKSVTTTGSNPDKYNYSKIGRKSIGLTDIDNEVRLKPSKKLRVIIVRDSSDRDKSLVNSMLLEVKYLDVGIGKWSTRRLEPIPFVIDGKVLWGNEVETLKNADHKLTVYYTKDDSAHTNSVTFTTDCDDARHEQIISY